MKLKVHTSEYKLYTVKEKEGSSNLHGKVVENSGLLKFMVSHVSGVSQRYKTCNGYQLRMHHLIAVDSTSMSM